MSWFFGIKRKHSNTTINPETIKKVITVPSLFIHKTEDLILYAGGLKETCLSNKTLRPEHGDSGWIVCGLGIQEKNSDFSYMTENKWDSVLSNKKFDNTEINGHYAIVKWHNNTIELYTDLLGLRRVYLMEHEGLVYFSTRLDWLLPFRNCNQIDFENLSSFWLLQNSYTYESIIKETKRLAPGSTCSITDHVSISKHNWLPSIRNSSVSSLETTIRKLSTLPFNCDKKIMLSLSGGIDCRTILSILLKHPKDKWLTYTSEEKDHPDTIVAREISTSLGFCHKLLCHGNNDPAFQINMCKDLALHMEMTYPLYLLNYLQLLTELYTGNYWMISGGLGELMKRAYGNRLIHHGKTFLLDKNASKIAEYLKGEKAQIFNSDINTLFNKHSVEHIEQAIATLPDIKNTGIENWVDLLQLKYRVANVPANSVGFFDSYIPNFMPLAQPYIMNQILSIPEHKRQNSKIHRAIIENNFKKLTEFPLVYNDTIVPYFTATNNYISKIWSITKNKLGTQFKPRFPQELLQNLKEPIFDRMLSSSVRSYQPYNYPFIKKTVTDFYEKEVNENTMAIYDWLSFDMWREIL